MTTSTPPGPRWLYLHGFASGPGSHKAVVLADYYRRQGIALERLDLRVPSLEHLRMDAMTAPSCLDRAWAVSPRAVLPRKPRASRP